MEKGVTVKTNNTSNRPRTAGALARTILLAGLAAGGNAATAQVLMIPREQKTSNNSLLNFCLIRYNAGSKTTVWRSTGGWMLLRIDYPQTVGEVKVRVEKLVVKGPAGWSFDAETGESPEATAAVFHGTKSADGWQEFAIGSDAYSARKYLRLTFDGAAELNGLEIWGSAVAAARFNHPGIFTTTSEADRVRATVGAGEESFRSAWTDEGLQRCKGFTLTPNLGVADYVRCNDPDVYCSQFAVFGKQLSFLAAYWQVRGGDQLPANMTAALLKPGPKKRRCWRERRPRCGAFTGSPTRPN